MSYGEHWRIDWAEGIFPLEISKKLGYGTRSGGIECGECGVKNGPERPYGVSFGNKKVERAANDLPQRIKESFAALLLELGRFGPTRTGWPHYGKLTGTKKGLDRRHCHLRGGSKPRYVVCWEVLVNGGEKEIRIYYVGSHENAPY